MVSSQFMEKVENRFKKFMYCSVQGLKKDYLCKQSKIIDSEVSQEDIFVYIQKDTDFEFHLNVMDEICNKQLYNTVISLTDKQRCILFMLVLDGYSESEVASELNISQQRVNKVKNKVLAKLKKNLEE